MLPKWQFCHADREASTPVNLHVARDGMQALLMLAGYLAKPDLVILDLNLPILSGCEMLEKYHPSDVPTGTPQSLGLAYLLPN
jgi:CheY-like chemotaxis protein